MNSCIKLAKDTTEYFVRSKQAPVLPSSLPSDLIPQQACYISIFESPGRRLRAMYGSPLPRHPSLAQEIISNTIQAISNSCSRAIRRADLPSISYAVAVLNSLQRISDHSHLDPRNFGLYIRSDQGKSTILLPQRAGIETAQEQVATALRESGINERNEAVTMYRFGVTYFE
jgi:AMMECR1 domain-containing protein